MKNKLFLLSAVAGLLAITSCSSGPSEETKRKVAAFDSAWTAMGTLAMAWGDSLNNALSMCETACKDGDAMSCCEHLAHTKDSLMAPCKNNLATFQEMKKNWDAEMPMWNALQAKLDSLKDGVAKGTITDEKINSALAELQAASDKRGAEMGPWIEKFNAARATCKQNIDNCKMAWSNTKCPDKKCTHGKEEKKS